MLCLADTRDAEYIQLGCNYLALIDLETERTGVPRYYLYIYVSASLNTMRDVLLRSYSSCTVIAVQYLVRRLEKKVLSATII